MSPAVTGVMVAGVGLLGAAGMLHGYAANGRVTFFAGALLLTAALGPGVWIATQRAGWGVLQRAGVAVSLYLATLLVVEGAWAAWAALRPEPETAPVYDYARARADPAGFQRWWEQRMQRWFRISHEFTQPDPTGRNPYVLAPGVDFVRYGSSIHINRLGLRGPEIEIQKGDRFRIVALGESTTFGLTLLPHDRPWPELLQERIAAEYACDAPVQVINAGVPGWTIANQTLRFDRDIAPLSPDLVLSYHGYNGFEYFLKGLPSVRVHAPPALPDRPSRIAGGLERALRLWAFRRRYAATNALGAELSNVPLLANPYARQYAALIRVTRARGGRIALATFNMAVRADSPEEAIRFYEAIVPDVRLRIAANHLHNEIVRAVGERYRTLVIDTSAELDGAYRDAYVDIAHFTQAGRERFAGNLLTGLHALLQEHPRLRCRARPDAR